VVDGAIETVEVSPFEVVTETELTETMLDDETYDETSTGTVKVEPDGVVMTSVMYGVDEAGVSTVVVLPDGVVTVTASRDGT
jgi:hypothetical protein